MAMHHGHIKNQLIGFSAICCGSLGLDTWIVDGDVLEI
jgi:hypothetical protein